MAKTSQIKVPVDFSSNFDEVSKLPLGNVSPDEFLRWKFKLLTSIESNPKLLGVATLPPEESWHHFCDMNGCKYTSASLESLYVGCQMEVWGFIMRSLDWSLSSQLEKEFQLKGDNLLNRLGFQRSERPHPSSYKSAYDLLRRLDDIYLQKSFFRTMELQRDLAHLEYEGNQDPRVFLQDFHEIFNIGKLLGDGWPTYDDRSMAMCLLGKLVGESLQTVRLNALLKAEKKEFGLKDVENELIRWWSQKPLNEDTWTTDEALTSESSNKEPQEGDHSSSISEIDDDISDLDHVDENVIHDVDGNQPNDLTDNPDGEEKYAHSTTRGCESSGTDPETLLHENQNREKEKIRFSYPKKAPTTTRSIGPKLTLKEKKRLRKQGR
jgi:hypothetical protein